MLQKLPVCRIQKLNMKCEIERMEINYTFFFSLFERFTKVIKKLLTFCYWENREEYQRRCIKLHGRSILGS